MAPSPHCPFHPLPRLPEDLSAIDARSSFRKKTATAVFCARVDPLVLWA